MVLSLPKKILLSALFVVLLIALGLLLFYMTARGRVSSSLMGGAVHTMAAPSGVPADTAAGEADAERFQRPSSQPALKNAYKFADFEKDRGGEPLSLDNFQTSEDVILAFFGILRDAANMKDYSGGCGTIGSATLPYPYAYELLSEGRKKEMSLGQFEDSFGGIGYITLLKLCPVYTPPGTPENIRYHMVECEIITGAASDDPAGFRSGSHFAYFYGIITTERDHAGWKIKAIDYFPEDFLCAPMHGWDYDAQSLVSIVYQNWYHLIDRVDKTEQDGNKISVYASGGGEQYRFDFVRITNGEDVLLHELVNHSGMWEEVSLLNSRDQGLKLSILNPNLERG
jgi:hypothetical protein